MASDAGSAARADLSRGGLLARNTLFSIGGRGATLVAAVVAIPLLVDELGTARFGVLALAWAVIAYSTVFDLGLGRALTKLTAERLGAGREDELPHFFWTAIALMLALGLAGAAVVAAASPWLVKSVLDVPARYETQTVESFVVLAASLPLVISGDGLRGHLEARQRFDLVNAVVVPVAVLTYFGPVLALQIADSLVAVVAAVAISRLVAWIANLTQCLRVTPALRRRVRVRWAAVRPLAGFGGWYTVWNTINALFLTADRFLVGAILSVTAVAFYATPYEAVTKIFIVTWALIGVLFPAFALNLAGDPARAARLFSSGIRFSFIAIFPLVLVFVTFAHEGLLLWLGRDFAENSDRVLQWLAAGVLAASIGSVANALVQSGRPDISAKVVLAELPLYGTLFVLLIHSHGIEGAAVAWSARALVDAAILLLVVRRLSPANRGLIVRALPAALAAAAALALGSQLEEPAVKAGFLLATLAAFGALAWLKLLRPEERGLVQARLSGSTPQRA